MLLAQLVNSMKDKLSLKTKEQIDLITDPVCLSILNLMEDCVPLTKEQLAQRMGEKVELVSRYVDEMAQHGILTVDRQAEGQPLYQKAATEYNMDKSLKNFNPDIAANWVLGLLNHVENNTVEMLKISESEDREALLHEMGYESWTFSNSTIYLTREEVRELKQFLGKFLAEHASSPKADGDERRAYELTVVLHPEVQSLRKALKEPKLKD